MFILLCRESPAPARQEVAAPHPVADKLISLFSIIRDCENSEERYFRFLRRWMDVEGTMNFVSHDPMFLRGLSSRVLELGGESGTDRHPTVYPRSYIEYVQKLGHEANGIYS